MLTLEEKAGTLTNRSESHDSEDYSRPESSKMQQAAFYNQIQPTLLAEEMNLRN